MKNTLPRLLSGALAWSPHSSLSLGVDFIFSIQEAGRPP